MPNRRVSEAEALKRLRDSGFDTSEPYPGSNRPWEARCRKCKNVSARTLYSHEHYGCRYCIGKSLSQAEIQQFESRLGLSLTRKKDGKLQAQCSLCKHSFAVRTHQLRDGLGCPYCVGNSSVGQENRRVRPFKVEPDVAEHRLRALGFEPLEPWKNGGHPWRVRCTTCGQESTKRWSSIKDQRGCIYCKKLRVSHHDAVAAMRASGLEPLEPYPGVQRLWKCRCGVCGEVTKISRQQVMGGRTCPYCAGNQITKSAALEIVRLAGFDAVDLKVRQSGSSVIVDAPHLIRCTVCQQVSRKSLRILRTGSQCKFCSGKAVASEAWESVLQDKHLRALVAFPGSNTPWKCECIKCHRTVHPTYSRMASGGLGCAYCSRKRLTLEDVEQIFASRNFELKGQYRNSRTPVACRCLDCDSDVRLRLDVLQRGSGCPACAPYGINLSGPGILYLISHLDLNAIKIGIAKGESRLQVHERYGWKVHRIEKFRTLSKGAYVEKKTLALWKIRGVYRPQTRQLMPQGGWTETAALDEVRLATEVARMRRWASQIRPRRGRLPPA